MILDNLTRAVKAQNSFAAGIEFVIIIVGVVIDFQIDAGRGGSPPETLEREIAP